MSDGKGENVNFKRPIPVRKSEKTFFKIEQFWFGHITAYCHHRCVKFRILDPLKDEGSWSFVPDS